MSEQKNNCQIVCQNCGKVLDQYEACVLGPDGDLYYLCDRCCFGPVPERNSENEPEKTDAA